VAERVSGRMVSMKLLLILVMFSTQSCFCLTTSFLWDSGPPRVNFHVPDKVVDQVYSVRVSKFYILRKAPGMGFRVALPYRLNDPEKNTDEIPVSSFERFRFPTRKMPAEGFFVFEAGVQAGESLDKISMKEFIEKKILSNADKKDLPIHIAELYKAAVFMERGHLFLQTLSVTDPKFESTRFACGDIRYQARLEDQAEYKVVVLKEPVDLNLMISGSSGKDYPRYIFNIVLTPVTVAVDVVAVPFFMLYMYFAGVH
jgi:hypothetical protein